MFGHLRVFTAHSALGSIAPGKLNWCNPCTQEICIKTQDIISPVKMESWDLRNTKDIHVSLPDSGGRNFIVLNPPGTGTGL